MFMRVRRAGYVTYVRGVPPPVPPRRPSRPTPPRRNLVYVTTREEARPDIESRSYRP